IFEKSAYDPGTCHQTSQYVELRIFFPVYARIISTTAGQPLTDRPMTQADAWRMIHRRARATGITAYLENGGTLEHAQQIAAHESFRTTKLYDGTTDQVSLDRIAI